MPPVQHRQRLQNNKCIQLSVTHSVNCSVDHNRFIVLFSAKRNNSCSRYHHAGFCHAELLERDLAIDGLSVCPSVCPSVCLSVARYY